MTSYEMLKPSFVMAGKVCPDDVLEESERPCFGRYWWFWLPRFSTNGGTFRRKDWWVTFQAQWLCFGVDLDWVRRK